MKIEKDGYLEFAQLLKIPVTYAFHVKQCKYFAQIQSFALIPKFISKIYSFLILFQLFLSTMLFSLAINDSKDTISKIFNLFAPLLCGGGFINDNAAIITSLALTVFDLLSFLLIYYRVFMFDKNKVITQFEETSILILSKFILPLTLPLIASSLPYIASTFGTGQITALNILTFVLGIIVIVVTLLLQYLYFTPRIMFSEEFMHEWYSSISTFTTLMIVFSAIVLMTARCTTKGVRVGIETFQMISMGTYSFYAFITRAYVNPFAMKMVCSVTTALTVTSIINIVSIFTPISSINTLFVFLIFFAIFFIIAGSANAIIMKSYIKIIDDFDNDPTSVKPNKLAIAFRGTIDLFHPALFSFTNYGKILDDVNNNEDLLIVFARLIASFPRFKSYLPDLQNRIKHSKILTKMIYELELNFINNTRSTSLNPEVFKFFTDSTRYEKSIHYSVLKFWNNVAADRIDNFWSILDNVEKLVNPMLADTNQIVVYYENIPEVISKVIKFHIDVTHRYDIVEKLNESLELLKSHKPTHPDRALRNFMKIFPGISNVMPEYTEEITVQKTIEDADTQEYEEKRPLYDTIKSSRLGSSTCISVYLLFASLCVIGVSYLLYYNFQQKVIRNVFNTSFVFEVLNDLLFNIARYGLLLSEKQALSSPNSPMKNDDKTMLGISPNWFGKYDDIPRFIVDQKQISDVSIDIRRNLEDLATGVTKLDKDCKFVTDFIDYYTLRKIKGLNSTLEVSIAKLIMRTKVDEQFVDDIFLLYNTLKDCIEKFADSTTFDKSFEDTTLFMVILITLNVLLVSLPTMFHIYVTIIQMNEISEAFSTISSSSIREALGVTDNSIVSEENYSMELASITNLNFNFYMYGSMILTIAPVVLCTVVFFFYGIVYVDHSNHYTKSGAFTKLGTASARISYIAMIQAFEEAYEGTTPKYLDKPIVKKSMNIVKEMIEATKIDVVKSTLMMSNEYHKWIMIEDNYRTTYPPLDENLTKIPAAGADFERLAAQKWRDSLDNFVFIISITAPGDFLSLKNYAFGTYFGWWMYEAREIPFYDLIKEEYIKNTGATDKMKYDLMIMVLFIVCSYVFIVVGFNSFTNRIRFALRSLLILKPETIINNEPIMSLILKGRYINETNDVFQTSNAYIKYTDYGIAKIDEEYNISFKNPAFEGMLKDINNLQELESDPSNEVATTPALLSDIKTAFKGVTPRISQKISVVLNGIPMYFEVHIVAISGNRLTFENDDAKVSYCTIVVKNITEKIKADSIIKTKRNELDTILKNVLPEIIVTNLEKGSESLSFNVHNITMGEIRVRASKRFSFITKDPHEFYNKVYKIFDKIIANYPLLNKIRTFAHNYTFAGGLFMNVNKPERHSEEVIRFLLDVIKHLPEISSECKTEVSLLICVHTGGPIIAGVMSLDMPSFVVLGNVHRYLHELKIFSETNVIHITRAVYELIFSSGFNITESDTIQVGDESVSTYTIYP